MPPWRRSTARSPAQTRLRSPTRSARSPRAPARWPTRWRVRTRLQRVGRPGSALAGLPEARVSSASGSGSGSRVGAPGPGTKADCDQMFTAPEGGGASLDLKPNETEGTMPQIMVTANEPTEDNEQPWMLRARVSAEDFQSDHFQAQLVQRLGWAVADAAEVERAPSRRQPLPKIGRAHVWTPVTPTHRM